MVTITFEAVDILNLASRLIVSCPVQNTRISMRLCWTLAMIKLVRFAVLVVFHYLTAVHMYTEIDLKFLLASQFAMSTHSRIICLSGRRLTVEWRWSLTVLGNDGTLQGSLWDSLVYAPRNFPHPCQQFRGLPSIGSYYSVNMNWRLGFDKRSCDKTR